MDDLGQRLASAILSVHYHDPQRDLHTWRLLQPDGAVQIFDGSAWRSDYRLSSADLARVTQAVHDCGLPQAGALHAPDVHDAAVYAVAWALPDGSRGEVVNHAYPAVKHPAMECLLDLLLDLEEEYSGEL